MNEWMIITTVVLLFGFILGVAKVIAPLVRSITKLTTIVGRLDEAFSKFKDHSSESHRRLWDHNETQDRQLADHDNRITSLETINRVREEH